MEDVEFDVEKWCWVCGARHGIFVVYDGVNGVKYMCTDEVRCVSRRMAQRVAEMVEVPIREAKRLYRGLRR